MHSFVALWLSFVTTAKAATCYNLELTWKNHAPDGFEREMILINGQFPGPLIELLQDDWVEITVVNKMPFNTTLHAHGIEQIGTPWADGVPGLSQVPIQPDESYTYKWQATEHGSYFYHAHARGQIDDGCYGPIIIKPRANIQKPFDRIAPEDIALLEAAEWKSTPVIVSDWRHTTSDRTWELELASGLESAVCMDSLLVNGKGAVDCWSREQLTEFTSPAVAPIFEQTGLKMTDKGCLPAEALKILLAGDSATNVSALPEEIFNVCTPTQGSREIIKASSSAKWIALDVISTAGLDSFSFSIDEHSLWVYAVDGHYIEPLKVDVLSIYNGDRYSVFVKLDKPAANYGIRLASTALAQLVDTTAVLAYDPKPTGNGTDSINLTADGAYPINSTSSINRAGFGVSTNVTFFNQAEMVSFPPRFPQPPPEVDQTFVLSLDTVGSSYIWALNDTIYNHAIDNTNPPLLYQQPNANNPGGNITITTKNNTWVDVVFAVVTLGQPPHPIHKHSNKAFIIGQGEGAFNWTTVAEAAAAIPQNFNLVTPPLRDGFVTPPTATAPTWLAVRYHVVNPGAWMLHCHIQSHLNGGMAMVILDGVDEWPEVPDNIRM